MTTITWLHISDLHFRVGPAFEEFNRRVVLRALWQDIRNQIDQGLDPDFIAFTGDVAYSGDVEEYTLAAKFFFDPLLETTGVSKDRIFVVPGNHDVEWSKIDPSLARTMCNLLGDRDQTNQFLSHEHDRGSAFYKFDAYSRFVNSYFEGALSFDIGEYFYVRSIQVGGTRIFIIGLNSAWMSACKRNDKGEVLDLGNLLIGEKQLEEALDRIEDGGLRIALLHHPLEWLQENDRFRVEKRLDSECDFILHGHWHIPRIEIRQSLAGQAVHIPVGALFSSRDSLNGYCFARVDLEQMQGAVYFRRYNDDGPNGPEWTADTFSIGEGSQGVCYFSLVNPSKGSRDNAGLIKHKIRGESDHDSRILRELMARSFDSDELRLLCSDLKLGLEYDELKGGNRLAKTDALIRHFERRNEIPRLLEGLKTRRPSVGWEDVLV
jgi:predicted phosphodiesterase